MASRRRRSERKRVVRDLNKFLEQAMRRVQLRCYQALTLVSPVDTGFFRAGYSPSIGAPDRSSPSTPPAAAEAARTQAASLLSSHGQAAEILASVYTLSQGPIFIVNNVTYGVFLNQGSSAQAPAMFVEAAIATAVQAASRDLQ